MLAIIPAHRKLRQEDGKFEVSLGYIGTLIQNKMENKTESNGPLLGPRIHCDMRGT